jgi:D-glycero-D-manno-heptose 1,7-bisphosphate phosphatase
MRTKKMKTRPKGVVFIDRDGTIVKIYEGRPANTVDEIELLPGVPEGMRELKDAGLQVILATNQGGIALGYMTEEVLLAMNARINELLALSKAPAIDAVYFCPHAPTAGCYCRKPNPGMLLAAARDLDIDVQKSYFIGDDVRDMDCAFRAGVPQRYMVVSDRYNDTPFATAVVPTFKDAARMVVLREKAGIS